MQPQVTPIATPVQLKHSGVWGWYMIDAKGGFVCDFASKAIGEYVVQAVNVKAENDGSLKGDSNESGSNIKNV